MVHVVAGSVGSCTWAIQTPPGSFRDPFKIGSDRNRSATVWTIRPRWLLTQGLSVGGLGLGSLCSGTGALVHGSHECHLPQVGPLAWTGVGVGGCPCPCPGGVRWRSRIQGQGLVVRTERHTLGLFGGETQPDRRAPSSVPDADQHQSDTVACFGTMTPTLANCMYNHGACGALRLCTAPWTRNYRMALPGLALNAPPGRLGLRWRCCSVIGHVGQARVVINRLVGI